jgi:hypothetical protein
MCPFAVDPSSRIALDRSGFKLTASLELVEAKAESIPRELKARAALTPSAIIAVRRRRKANRDPL